MSAANPSLTGTHWTLVALGTTPLAEGATQREPFITLTDAEQRLNGSNGCNLVFGRYALRGDALTFSDIGSTKMACLKGMEIESAFANALARAATWRVTGQHLELSDPGGTIVARFAGQSAK